MFLLPCTYRHYFTQFLPHLISFFLANAFPLHHIIRIFILLLVMFLFHSFCLIHFPSSVPVTLTNQGNSVAFPHWFLLPRTIGQPIHLIFLFENIISLRTVQILPEKLPPAPVMITPATSFLASFSPLLLPLPLLYLLLPCFFLAVLLH